MEVEDRRNRKRGKQVVGVGSKFITKGEENPTKKLNDLLRDKINNIFIKKMMRIFMSMLIILTAILE